MPVDLNRNLVFIHVPKTGGTSVEAALGLLNKEHFFCRTPCADLVPANKTPQHFTWRELNNNLPPASLANCFKFAFVRNPWDRFVSEFCWRRALYSRYLRGMKDCFYGPQDLENLDTFVRILELPPDERNDARRGFDSHLEEQRSFLIDDAGKIAVDFVGRFESLLDDLRIVASACNSVLGVVPQLMKSPRRPDYRSYYSVYARSAVASFYQADIQEFNYEF